MLPRPHRLPSSRIKSVMRYGKRDMREGMRMFTLKNNLDISRYAFVVPTRLDKRAVVRNRIKRLMREWVRTHLPQLPKGEDVVIIARRT